MRRGPVIAAVALAACVVVAGASIGPAGVPGWKTPTATAASASELSDRLSRAESEAATLRADLSERRQAMLNAEAEAEDARRRERELAGFLAEGRQTRIDLEQAAADAELRVRVESSRLARAHGALAGRLVAIYKAGPPDTAALAVSAEGFDDLITRTEYMRVIHRADAALAGRVEQVRARVEAGRAELEAGLQAALAHEAAVERAHSIRVAVSAAADSRAATLSGAAAERDAALTELTARMSDWEREIAVAQRRQAREQASSAEAVPEVESVEAWLGGPYSIPTTIVMCESGGNYRALNPSSGAGGAYQIIPSTWDYYGGEGLPHLASKAEQDRIAALIWANDGPGAWVCKE